MGCNSFKEFVQVDQNHGFEGFTHYVEVLNSGESGLVVQILEIFQHGTSQTLHVAFGHLRILGVDWQDTSLIKPAAMPQRASIPIFLLLVWVEVTYLFLQKSMRNRIVWSFYRWAASDARFSMSFLPQSCLSLLLSPRSLAILSSSQLSWSMGTLIYKYAGISPLFCNKLQTAMKQTHVIRRHHKKQSHFSSQGALESHSSQNQTADNPKLRQINSQTICSTPLTKKSAFAHHQHTRTFQLLNQSKESQFYSDDSENDIFRDVHNKKPNSSTLHVKSRSKILNQMAYITQKMIPQYEKGMQLLSQAENKIMDFNQSQIETIKLEPSSTLSYGEVPVYYSTDKHPIDLQPYVWNVQELRQMEFYYYKIRSKSMFAPLQFHMNQTQPTNFKIFVSSVNPFPTKFSCDQVYCVKGWKYKADDHKLFSNDYIYFSLVCDLDTVVKMKYQFGNESNRKSNVYVRQSFQSKPKEATIEKMPTDMLKSEIAEIKKRRRLKLMSGGPLKNLIQANIKNVQSFQEDLQRSFREYRKYQQESRIEEVIERKKVLNYQEQQQKELKQASKNIQKLLRQRQKQIQQKKDIRNRLCSGWMSFIYSTILAAKIQATFLHKVEAIKQSRMMAFQVKRIMKRMHNRLAQTKGVTLFDRVQFDTRMCLAMFCEQIYEKQERMHIQLILPTLRYRALIYKLKFQLQRTIYLRGRIRQVFKEFMLRYALYKGNLMNAWNKYFQTQFQSLYNLLDQSKEQSFQLWFVAVQNQPMQSEVQQAFCKLYSKDKLQNYLKQMHEYSQTMQAMKEARAYSQSRKAGEVNGAGVDLRNLRKPRLFIIPTASDIFEYIPRVYEMTNQLLKDSQFNKHRRMQTHKQPTVIRQSKQ